MLCLSPACSLAICFMLSMYVLCVSILCGRPLFIKCCCSVLIPFFSLFFLLHHHQLHRHPRLSFFLFFVCSIMLLLLLLLMVFFSSSSIDSQYFCVHASFLLLFLFFSFRFSSYSMYLFFHCMIVLCCYSCFLLLSFVHSRVWSLSFTHHPYSLSPYSNPISNTHCCC